MERGPFPQVFQVDRVRCSSQDRARPPFVVVRIKQRKDQSKRLLEVIDRKILSARKIINRVLSEDGFVLIWH